jgi:hypothetical protein
MDEADVFGKDSTAGVTMQSTAMPSSDNFHVPPWKTQDGKIEEKAHK